MTQPDNKPATDPLPIDPSETNQYGEKVEQGVVKIKEGITEQSAGWEDEDSRRQESDMAEKAVENYLKNPSPEERSDNA